MARDGIEYDEEEERVRGLGQTQHASPWEAEIEDLHAHHTLACAAVDISAWREERRVSFLHAGHGFGLEHDVLWKRLAKVKWEREANSA